MAIVNIRVRKITFPTTSKTHKISKCTQHTNSEKAPMNFALFTLFSLVVEYTHTHRIKLFCHFKLYSMLLCVPFIFSSFTDSGTKKIAKISIFAPN